MHVPLELKSTNVADLNRQFQISVNFNQKKYPRKHSERHNTQILTRRSLWKCLCTDVWMYPRGEPSCHRHRMQWDDHRVKTWQGQTKWQGEKSHFMWKNRKGYHSLIPRTAHPVRVPVERVEEFLPFYTPHFHRLVIWSRDQPLAIAGEMNASNACCVSFEHCRLALSVTHIHDNASRTNTNNTLELKSRYLYSHAGCPKSNRLISGWRCHQRSTWRKMNTSNNICVSHKPKRPCFWSEIPDHKVFVTGSSSCKWSCKWLYWDVLLQENRR